MKTDGGGQRFSPPSARRLRLRPLPLRLGPHIEATASPKANILASCYPLASPSLPCTHAVGFSFRPATGAAASRRLSTDCCRGLRTLSSFLTQLLGIRLSGALDSPVTAGLLLPGRKARVCSLPLDPVPLVCSLAISCTDSHSAPQSFSASVWVHFNLIHTRQPWYSLIAARFLHDQLFLLLEFPLRNPGSPAVDAKPEL